MITIIHERQVTRYREEPEVRFGFSSRAAYAMAMDKPNYPVPALIQDSQSDLAIRWSNWLDDDRLAGHKY